MNKKNKKLLLFSLFLILIIGLFTYYYQNSNILNSYSYAIDNIPAYNGENYIIINNNEPVFDEKYFTMNSFESYSELDSLGRAGIAFANIGIDIMPNSKRDDISKVIPTGWMQKKYDIIKGKYLYNRCHLIGYQLTGENANKNNLITCTKEVNNGTMLEYENKVANYVRETHNHVLYRVTPIFIGNNLLASGIEMEAISIEDNGKGIKFNIYVYNVQEGIEINYLNGDSRLANN